MSLNSSVPERQTNVMSLPARAGDGMTRRQQRVVFEQVKVQVLDIATRYFDLSLRVLKRWINSGR